MTHLSRETLIAWRDHPTAEGRAHVVTHLAICDACTAAFADLVRTRPPGAPPQHFNAAEFTARGLGVRARVASRRSRWTWGWAALATAAVVVVAVFVAQPDVPPVSTSRGGTAALQALVPAGLVDDASTFTWTSTNDAGPFRLEISDAAGTVVFDTRVAGKLAFTLPADVRARLQRGVEYRWSVSRLDARGDTVDASALVRFTVR
jgi:hypothetical protein